MTKSGKRFLGGIFLLAAGCFLCVAALLAVSIFFPPGGFANIGEAEKIAKTFAVLGGFGLLLGLSFLISGRPDPIDSPQP